MAASSAACSIETFGADQGRTSRSSPTELGSTNNAAAANAMP
jgi:hypothetical protein